MNSFNKEKLFKNVVYLLVYFSFLFLFWPFKKSILFACLFAFSLSPILKITEKFIKNEKWNILFMISCLFFVFLGPLSSFVLKGLIHFSKLDQNQLLQNPFVQNIEMAISSLLNFIQQQAQYFGLNISEVIDWKSLIPKITQYVWPIVTDIATQLPGLFLQLIIFLATLYFLMLNRKKIKEWFNKLQLMSESSSDEMILFLQRTCNIIVVSTIVIASIQALIITFAALIAGYSEIFTLFLIVFVMSFIPVIGSAPVTVSLAIYAFIQNNYFAGIILIFAAVIASVIDNVIKTIVLSKEGDKVHPLISLLSLIGAMSIFGVTGLFLGPIISQLAFSIHKILNPKSEILISEN